MQHRAVERERRVALDRLAAVESKYQGLKAINTQLQVRSTLLDRLACAPTCVWCSPGWGGWVGQTRILELHAQIERLTWPASATDPAARLRSSTLTVPAAPATET